MKEAVLNLSNQSKSSHELSEVMQLANITSLWKKKGSRTDLSNDRRIFVLRVLRMIMDKTLYNEYYPSLEEACPHPIVGH